MAPVGLFANETHAQAGNQSGQLVVWGHQATGPAAIVPYTQVDWGYTNGIGLKADGSVSVWGIDYHENAIVPDSAVSVCQVATSEYHKIARRTDGAVVCWGAGTVDLGSGDHYGQSMVPASLPPAVFIAAGLHHSMAVASDGTVRCWGRYCGSASETYNVPPVGLTGVISGDSGIAHNTALRSNGAVSCWGNPANGQTTVPPGLPACTAVACGFNHSVAVTIFGMVSCWGLNSSGQCTIPGTLFGVTSVAAGRSHTAALKSDGSVVVWGSSTAGLSPPASLGPCTAVFAGTYSTGAIEVDGQVRMWGGGQEPSSHSGLVAAADIGGSHVIVAHADGSVAAWGSNYSGQASVPAAVQAEHIVAVAAGVGHNLAMSARGELFAWGHNSDGQTDIPAGIGSVSLIDAGHHRSMAKQIGEVAGVVCWGNNEYGQNNVPTAFAPGTVTLPVSDIACGGSHSVVLIGPSGGGGFSNSVMGWGLNTDGQCNLMASCIAVAAAEHTVAIKTDGTVACWGPNADGQCTVPADLGTVTRIAASSGNTIALRTDGRVRAWGDNTFGQLNVPAYLNHAADVFATGAGGSFGAMVSSDYASCNNGATPKQTATLAVSGCRWEEVSIWNWTGGFGPSIPGSGSAVDLGAYGSVGSGCDATCESLLAHGGSSLLVPVDLSVPSAGQPDYSIDVTGTANLAGRIWLIGSGASTLPIDLNIPVLRTGNPVAGFDIVQTTVPPPPGYFLTLVPSAGVQGQTQFSLRLLPLQSGAGLVGSSSGSFNGEAVAAEAMDWNGDGFHDLALAITFGPGQNGALQVLLNDGAGNLGSASLLLSTPPEPTCLAVGDLNSDGKSDAVVGTASDVRVHLYYNNAPTASPPFVAGPVIDPEGMPLSVVVLEAPASFQGIGGDVATGSNGGKSGTTKVTVNDGTTGALEGDPVVVSTTPTTTTRRGGRLATGGSSSSSVEGGVPGLVSVLEWRQVGTPPTWQLEEIQVLDVPGTPVAIEMVDIDGDGHDEIVTANEAPQFQGTGTALPVLTMFRGLSGATAFGSAVPIAPQGASAGLDIAIIDVDNDGDRDLISVQRSLGAETTASTIRIDTAGPGGALTIGDQTALAATHPTLCTRGNLDGIGGEDLFLVDNGGASLVEGGPSQLAHPFLGDPGERWTDAADINGDGVVNGGDLGLLLASWGACVNEECPSDIDGDGTVDAADLSMLLASWGASYAVVTGVSPDHGSPLGGTLISISGSSLAATTGVRLDNAECTNVQVVSPALVTAITPPGVGLATIRLVSPNGTTTAPMTFSYDMPSITAVTPNQGYATGGTAITITGTFLNGATSVRVGGVAATNVVAVSATTVTAVTPAGTVGPKSVEVTSLNGTTSASGAFSYIASPSLPAWATLIEALPDPAVVTNASMRAAITASGWAWRVRDSATQMEMLLVPPGNFWMGCSPSNSYTCSASESPVHQVSLTNAFYMGRYEVTQAQWTARMGSNPSFHQGASYPNAATRPVEQVSWDTIQGFLTATGMRLPTEAEREYACRAGTTTAFHSGPSFPLGTNDDSLVPQIAWCSSNSGGQTHVVGGKAANALGLHDVSGNVWEWCFDWYGTYGSTAATNPTGPVSGTYRIIRGGAWDGNSNGMRSSTRSYGTLSGADKYVGFRTAKNPALQMVTGVSPQHGSTLGGTPISVNGLSLAGTTAVLVGGVPCTNLQVISPTLVTALTPAGASGDAAVTVVSPVGTVPSPIPFSYVLQTITSVAPNSGPTSGGTAITITGTYLSGATSVKIGGVAATNVIAVNSTTVTAVTSAGPAGSQTVEVTTPKGTASLSAGFFYYNNPGWGTVLEWSPNPNVVTNAVARAAIIASGLAWRVRDTATQIEMVLVPPGTFTMGCSASNSYACIAAESPVHQVTLTNAYYIGRYEVTQSQWQARMGSNPSQFQGASYPDAANRPVERVSWTTIQGFLEATGLRLPTEAEWEYACRAGTATAFHSMPVAPSGTSNDDLATNIAWYSANSGSQTHPVGGKASNALGIHDMSGNVWEWVNDWYGGYTSNAQTNPTGPATGSNRVVHGGAWDGSTNGLRSSYRGNLAPTFSNQNFGFRVVRNP